MKSLNDRLLAAYATGDHAALVRLYTEAADLAPTLDAEGFFLTQAHVFAMETGLPEAQMLRDRLVLMGRETPL